MITMQELMKAPRGYTVLFSLDNAGNVTRAVYHHNLIMNGMSEAAARVLSGDTRYKAGAMYFEFQNLASPGDTPVYPVFDATEDVSYYTGLQFSATNDFIRVPILAAPNVQVSSTGALLTLYALAPSTSIGFWGKPFTSAANSVVIGGAVVATPDISVQSNDVIMCRNYPPNTKVPRVEGEQIGIIWNIEFPYAQAES